MKTTKTKLTFFAILCMLLAHTVSAKIWRVNNATNVTADFTKASDAIASINVVNGDTLYIEGSATKYAGFIVTKRLVIIGPGFFLSENPETNLEGAQAIVNGTITFNTGSDGSILSGIFLGTALYCYPYIKANNISITHCYLEDGVLIGGTVNGTVISQNYITWSIGFDSYTVMSGTVLKNNIVNADFTSATSNDYPRTFAAVENNLFLGSVNVTTSTYRNNVWLPQTPNSQTLTVVAGTNEYNLSLNTNLNGSNNTAFANTSDLYTGTGSTDGKWQIKAGSVYKNAGSDGTDPGPFGGSNPYVLSGVPPIPVIYEISTTGYGSQADGLPVTIKVRAN